ncbi:hypothetical protein F53441_6800 [Fusarium austroafricanum]|uniref:FAD-binding domain-containing protein n=1 Tax=Fusarium austroafricanum TaxID=2364996 RepID=A0A8H4NZ49_9HYPO|nr:hypothetical protein F53441_6800 [Fusarium austroafricanum]
MTVSKIAPIAIIGGGPCGLTLARLLETASINYVVFERDASPTSAVKGQGGTLDIHPTTGQEALRRAGLHDQFKALARYDATTMTLMDSRGEFRSFLGDDLDVDGSDRPEIDRQQLRQILLNSIPAERIRWGKTTDAVERKSSDGKSAHDYTLKFRDGSTESGFRMIVGADGAWSKVRSLITDAKPEYSGKSFVEGRVSPNNPAYKLAEQMAGKGTAMAMSAQSTLAVQQMSDASYRMYMGLLAPESLTLPGGDADPTNMEKARNTMLGPGGFFESWTEDLRTLIGAAEAPWRPWPLYRLDKTLFSSEENSQHRWIRAPGVVLLGDAAHLSTPNGEGVNQAMFDSLVLFDQIVSEVGAIQGDVYDQEADAEALERAIVAYEKEMKPRAYEHIKSSIDMETLMYNDDGAQQLIAAFAQEHGPK